MEDPWAAGPSWSTPAKQPRQTDEDRHTATPPPPGDLDDDDPWGAGPTKVAPPTWADDRPKWEVHPTPTLLDISTTEEEPPTFAADSAPSKQEPEPLIVPQDFVLNSPSRSPATLPAEERRMSTGDDTALSRTEEPALDDLTIPGPSRSSPLPQATPDEVDPEAQFLSALKIASPKPSFSSPQSPSKSPVFSDGGFGGFSSHMEGSDPWGGGAGMPEASGSRMPAWGSSAEDDAGFSPTLSHDADADDGNGWGGGPTSGDIGARGTTHDEDWEEAQRVMRLRADRVPDEKVQKLKTEWSEIAEAVAGKGRLDKLSNDEESKLEQEVTSMQGEMRETLRSLSSIPSDISTYPPVISSLITHERHIYALSRPNPVPSTSLLNVSLARRSRNVGTLSSSSPWLSRSRLGEPDVAQPEPTAPSMSPEDPKAKWSFWGRKATPKPLVTSGGSILEVKTPPPEAVRASGSGEMARSSSRAPSISISSRSSRPASPAIPSMTSPPQPSLQPTMPNSVSMESVGHPASSGTLATQTPQGPSAVSRFFGRLSRKHSSQPSAEFDGTDLQLSTDDFNFLQEVPGLADSSSMGHDTGDLVSLEPGRSEQIAGLESMLASKPMAVAPPFAPPPSAVASARAQSSARFVARMKPPAATDMDLLGGLDFDSDASASPTKSLRGGPPGNAIMWDDFLDSGQPTATQQASQTLQKSTASPVQTLRSPHPPIAAPSVSSPIPAKDPFDDFASPQKPSTSISFDDFGDFADFTQGAAPISSLHLTTPAQPSRNHANLTLASPQSVAHGRNPSVDHSSTMNLMSEATALKGRRWPAPPSPAAPNLDPPPRPSNQRQASGGFPFLSPPPPPRPASGLTRTHDLLDDGEVPVPGAGSTPPPSVMPLWQSTLSPPVPQPAQGAASKNKPRLSAGSSLTASDLSFFDSI